MPKQALFTITMATASPNTCSVNYATRNGTATSPSDYTATSGVLTFAPGETTKTIAVPIRDSLDQNSPSEMFYVDLSNPINCMFGTSSSGTAIIPAGPGADTSYADRFRWMYNSLKTTSNGYYGPTTGTQAFKVPYHVPERIICEAPDWGHESVSETASFMVGLEAWKGIIDNEWTGYNQAWNTVETVYIPSSTNQPVGVYDPSSPADYTPEGDTPSAYPRLGSTTAAKGTDGLYSELLSTYGTKNMYLMHWIIDVDGVYGYHNGDGATKNVYINNYQRGLQESAWETVTHPSWEDFDHGGTYGYLPLFSQGKPTYPAAEFDYGQQWRYTCAPDAEARAVQWAFWANKYATAAGASSTISASNTKAKKMGDYLRYSLMDKYFRQIGPNRSQGSTSQAPYSACHYLISWYVSWGGEVPQGAEATWSFRIGSSESHQGYQAPDIAYFMATGGGGYTPQSPSAGDIWLGSLYRQLEMLRWLQTEQGPIAGGVTNSWLGRYETPNDGRQNSTFYGMHYTYAPVWHDPPSNNWFGFQTWGLHRVADLLLEVADKNTSLSLDVRNKCEVILDRFVKFCLDNVTLGAGAEFSLPDTLNWTSATQVPGETTTVPNLEGVYEYIPNTSWDGTGNFANFWSASTVPNNKLKFTIAATGKDLGVASTLAGLLIHYAQGKRLMNKFTTAIPLSAHTAEDAYLLAKGLLDRIWTYYRDAKGITREEGRTDYERFNDPIYIPSNFTGTMPNGDVLNSSSTFVSIRSFIQDDPEWPKIQAYLDNPIEANIPKFTYHRYWANAEFAMSNAAMHKYFEDLNT